LWESKASHAGHDGAGVGHQGGAVAAQQALQQEQQQQQQPQRYVGLDIKWQYLTKTAK
jgi:serine/threonine protein phosphatase PrpC